MGYTVVALLILGVIASAAVNVGYWVFAAAMSVVNAMSAEPVVFLHGRIIAEATAGTTIRYEVVRLHDASPYADRPVVVLDPDLLTCDADTPTLVARLAAADAPKNWALLVAGPVGSGRSTVAARLAEATGLPVVRRLGADLTAAPSGGASQAVALAFAEARAKQAALLLDGIDGVAGERGAPGTDDAALDALLAETDGHPLPLVCVADLPPRLDRAALRRFTLAVRLGALDPEKAALAFRRMLGAEPPGPLPEGLTPGDFAAVRLRRDLLGGDADAGTLLAWLAERAEAGGAAPRGVGFRVLAGGAGFG
ncbi:hypothetical protein GCM10009416_50250 [Craurococcus roseus]|uniref:AAA+ ATPase domain-containing protein n=1 Tax=Craurococcus roseus TaxID=77585 RepID=A0ABN1GAD4_9PROT